MTSPTSDRAQRIDRIADALRAYDVREMNATEAATVLVDTLAPDTERLGGGEREVVAPTLAVLREHSRRWTRVCIALDELTPGWILPASVSLDTGMDAANAVRTLAQTAEQGRACIELAESLGWNGSKSLSAFLSHFIGDLQVQNETLAQDAQDATARAEQSEKEVATLRAQLDAMTGEQKPFAYDVKGWGIFRCKDEQTLEKELQHAAKMTYRTDFQPIPLYRHPSPAARVVGACVENTNGEYSMWAKCAYQTQQECEKSAISHAQRLGGKPFLALRGPTLTPNADGAR